MLTKSENPLLFPKAEIAVDLERLPGSATAAVPTKREATRALLDHRRTQTAADAIAEFDQTRTVVGFTKGQFSLVQLLRAALAKTGPASLVLSTWTAANQDISDCLDFVESGTVDAARWLVDLSFSKRSPQLCQRLRQTFGADCIRVGKNHAKFALIANDAWRVVIETSMNLNHNPRFEYFRIQHDPELYDFFENIVAQIWKAQNKTLERQRPYEIVKHFNEKL